MAGSMGYAAFDTILTGFDSRRKCHDVLQLSLVSDSEADAGAAAQCVAEVQRALGLTSAGVITHPSPVSSPL